MENALYHHGIKGQKWGVRRYQNADGSLTAAGKARYGEDSSDKKSSTGSGDKSKASTAKKVAIGIGAATTVAAATAIYMNNKSAIDNFVKDYASTLLSPKYYPDSSTFKTAQKEAKTVEYVKTHKKEILKSASQLNKYKDFLSEKEVSAAVKSLQRTRDLHQISQDNIKRGANYVQAVLTYGTAATAAYNLTKSSLVKDAQREWKQRQNS